MCDPPIPGFSNSPPPPVLLKTIKLFSNLEKKLYKHYLKEIISLFLFSNIQFFSYITHLLYEHLSHIFIKIYKQIN